MRRKADREVGSWSLGEKPATMTTEVNRSNMMGLLKTIESDEEGMPSRTKYWSGGCMQTSSRNSPLRHYWHQVERHTGLRTKATARKVWTIVMWAIIANVTTMLLHHRMVPFWMNNSIRKIVLGRAVKGYRGQLNRRSRVVVVVDIVL